MTQRDPARQLAREIDDLRRELRSGSRGSQMRYRALEGGSIPVYDNDGGLRGEIGQLPDGTTGFVTVNGPKPIPPAAPIIFPLTGGLEVTWNGETFDRSPLPGDFRCVEVHASPYSVYTPDDTTLRASFVRPGTIAVSLPAGQPWTVVFIIRTTADAISDPSGYATETPLAAPSEEEILAARQDAADALAAAQTADARALEAAGLASTGKVYPQPEPPAADPSGLWIDTNDGNKPHRHNGTDWVAIQDAGIQTAADAAAAASTKADEASAAALEARDRADQAIAVGNGAQEAADIALSTANGKSTATWSVSSPLEMDPQPEGIAGDTWFRVDAFGLGRVVAMFEYVHNVGWQTRELNDTVLASLTVGKLTTGNIAVGQKIIAGAPDGTHVELTDTGLRVFAEDPIDGIPNEVIRMGTETNDFFGITDTTGNLKAAITDQGVINGQALNITGEARFGGHRLTDLFNDRPRGIIMRGSVNLGTFNASTGPIRSEYGLGQIVFPCEKGRTYEIHVNGPTYVIEGTDGYGHVRWIWRTAQTGNATISSTEAWTTSRDVWQSDMWQRETHAPIYWDAPWTGQCSFLFSVASDRDRSVWCYDNCFFTVIDVGVSKAGQTTKNSGGGALYQQAAPPPPPPSVQAYDTGDGIPAGWESYNGTGGRRNDTAGTVIQGRDPSGFNGNGQGTIWWNTPYITGNVTGVYLYLYSTHWYYNSGGSLVLNLTSNSGGVGWNYDRLRTAIRVDGYQRGAGKWITLPSEWWPEFRLGRAKGIVIGPGLSDDLIFYGKFDALATRLRIKYEQ